MKFRKGQRVVVTDKRHWLYSQQGKIIGFRGVPLICVESDKENKALHNGHSVTGVIGKNHHCWWMKEHKIKVTTIRYFLELVES